jgi:acyl dehydratase
VAVGSRVRLHTTIMDITEKNPGQYLVKASVTMEIEGVEKPAYIAETLSMWIT